jgi:hypothetical protein
MKKCVFLFLLAIGSFAYGQSQHTNKSAYFLDGVNFGKHAPLFSQDLINSVDISNKFVDKANNLYGAIYITTKTPSNFNFLGVNDIQRAYKIAANGPIIYMLNKDFIKETEHFKIDSAYVYKVEVIKGSEFDYLKNSIPNLSIVKIYTNTKENWPSKEMRIRGTASKE